LSPPPFLPVISLAWLERAYTVAGASGVLVGLLIWQQCKLGNHRRRDQRMPEGFVRLTYRRVHRSFGLHRDTFRSALTNLRDAGLIELRQPSRTSAYQVRLVPFPGEEHWTYSRLGNVVEAAKHKPKQRK